MLAVMQAEAKETSVHLSRMNENEDEDPGIHSEALRKYKLYRSYTDEDIQLSEKKMDRQTRLRKISFDRDFRSRHLNAIANRKLESHKSKLDKVSEKGITILSKEKKSLEKELVGLRREKSVTVDEHLAKVRGRSANARNGPRGQAVCCHGSSSKARYTEEKDKGKDKKGSPKIAKNMSIRTKTDTDSKVYG